MAKNTTKKIKELKGIKPEKITKEELGKVQDTIDNINKTKLDIGSLETQKHALLHNIAGWHDELKLIQSNFNKEYGTHDINITDGTINYKEENGQTN